MIALVCLLLTLLASPFKSKSRLEAENAALRRQLLILRRKVRGRVRLKNGDRLFFIQLYRWFPSCCGMLSTKQAHEQPHHFQKCALTASFEASRVVLAGSADHRERATLECDVLLACLQEMRGSDSLPEFSEATGSLSQAGAAN